MAVIMYWWCFINLSNIAKFIAIHLMQNSKQNIIKYKNLFSYMKIRREILTFGDVEIEKHKFSSPLKSYLKDVDIDKEWVVSNKISSGEKYYKYFIACFYDNYKIKPLYIMLPKSYVGQTKWMHFLIEDDELLEKHNTIQDKVSTDIKFDSEPVYKKTFLKNKTKSCHDEATGFCDREIPKASSNRNFLSLITIDSVH